MGRRARIRAAGRLESRLAEAVARYIDTGGVAGAGMSPWELPTVVACRRVIADTVAQTPLYGVRNGAPLARQPTIYTRPDPLEPRWLSIWRMVDQLTGYGHCWLQPTAWDAADWPLIVRVRDASAGAARFDPAGALEAVWLDGVEHGIGAQRGEIVWVPYDVPRAGSAGVPPMSRCWRAAEYLASLYEMAGSFWEAGFPSLALSVATRLGPGEPEKLKAQLLTAWARRHEPAVLDNGATLQPVGASAVESQLVESIAWANAEICRVHGVMPSIANVAAGDSLTYATTEAEFSKWRAIGLGPYLARLEAAWTDCAPHGTSATFDTSELTKPALAQQGEYFNLALAGEAWLTVDEVRARSHLPPMGAARPRPAPGDRPPTARVSVLRTAKDPTMTIAATAARAAATATRTATRTATAAVRAVTRDDGTRALDIELVPWDAPARVTDDGRRFYTETWRPGSLVDGELMAVYADHVRNRAGELVRGEVIGLAGTVEHRPGAAHTLAELADTPEARRVYELARVGLARASIEFDADPDGDGDVVHTAADPVRMSGVAIILPPNAPAFATSVTVARARRPAAAQPDPDPDTDDDDTAGDSDADDDDGTGDIPENRQIRAAGGVAELVRREVARFNLRPGPGRAGGPLARYACAADLEVAARAMPAGEVAALNRAFADAYRHYHQLRRLEASAGRALVDQVTADNPGVLPPAWITEVFGIVDTGRPAIVALGGPRSPGDTGLDVYWPYYAGDLTTIVGQQMAEKTEITSVKVSFARGQATLKTYAGGSDVSFQLQRRSSPSYMALYDRILQTAYGLTTENAFADAVLAGAGATVVYDPMAADADGAQLKAALFQASAQVKRATGAPASAVLAATDVYVHLGGQPWLQPPQYTTTNVPGIASASTLRINVSGLEIVEVTSLPDGAMIVTNAQAAAWLEEGPYLVRADDVAKLGTDVAIWGMGTPGLFVPAGIVKTTPVAGP